MISPASALRTTLATDKGPGRESSLVSIALWLAASAIAVLFALLVRDATFVGGTYAPFGNDSFYHARRILDAAVGSRGFYEFDDRLHVPDGMWIPWPWAYDYLVAQATKIALVVWPELDPFTFVAHVPVAWILVNAALFLAAARALGLSTEMRLLAMLCFALSPLTQLLHAVGNIDHHIVEHTFVLLAVWLGLRWFGRPGDPLRAAWLALALGVAPAFHNGLFILQLLPLLTVLVLWLRGTAPSATTLYVFGAVLVVATQAILLPSAAYRDGQFEFGLLSWFHIYVAVCTATTLAFMAWHARTRGSLVGLAVLCALLVAPLGKQLLDGAGFVSGTFSVLDQILEAQSPYRFIRNQGLIYTVSYYSWLLFLTPALLGYFAYRLWVEKGPAQIYYAVVVIFGLAMFLNQLRFHYFGFFAFVTAALLLLEKIRERFRWHRGGAFVLGFAVIALAYQPALRSRLFLMYAPGADTSYPAVLAILRDLENHCLEDPGLVLADSNDGSVILYHSECSVIANNFILTSEDHRQLEEIKRLMHLSPGDLRQQRPDVKYVFLRTSSFALSESGPDGSDATVLPLAEELLVAPEPPPGFSVIRSIYADVDESGPKNLLARLYKVAPLETAPPSAQRP